MKTTAIMLTALLSLFGSGCSTAGKILDQIPEGSATSIRYTRTGKFSTTTATVDGWEKTSQKVSADKLTLRHSNAWMPNVEVEMVDYKRDRGAAD